MSKIPPDLLQRIADGAAQRDAQREQPFDVIAEIKATGFGAGRLDAGYGGGGATFVETLATAIQLGAADPNVAHIWRNHHVALERLLNAPLQHAGVQRLRERVRAGDLVGASHTELGQPQIGGNAPLATRLVRQGDHYVLNGQKFYSTGSLFADWLHVTVSVEDGRRAVVLLPRQREGVQTVDDWFGMGQRLTGSGTTVFENVVVAADEVVLPDQVPVRQAVFGSTIAQLFLTSVIAGVVSAVARDGAALLGKRKRNYYYAPTPSAAQDPILLTALGERDADAFATRAVVLAAAAEADRAYAALKANAADADDRLQDAAAAAARAKITVDRIAHHAATALFDIAGASATLTQFNLDRHWRNIRTISTHNPTSHKAYALGNLSVNQVRLPTQGFF
ncbi:acyl-CoA dehydrogenase family protein [Herbaspirillum aquaticum]|uniref:Acyl-CoA dehydrogenase n=1 Tax=Herbaspirillum aquaticum TaxID=568783 RepID=A0A225SWL4_9BURK|nr:acyl-CoA dehydrogenase family protein [Herbaspirillum aquaticum]OWY35594.1 acyl-CoA dehydrogenase [Herbaspirillum aquaticum]